MAASVALKSYDILSNEYGNTYSIEILDMQGVYGSSFRFNIARGLQLSYESQSDERFTPIKGSSLTIPILVQNASQEGIILTQMLNSVTYGEDRWVVKVTKNSDLWWVGVVVFDLWQRQDASYPYSFNLVATDGLARLKNLEFTDMLTNNMESIGSIIRKILLKTPLYDVLTSGDAFYSNSVNWYDSNMPAVSNVTDPLYQTFIRRWALVDLDLEDTNQNKAISYYDALETLLLQFNCRILLSDGIFRIVTINQYEKSNILYERIYDDAGTFLSTSSPSWTQDIDQATDYVISGANQWQYYPAIRRIYRRYKLGQSENLIDPTLSILFPNSQSFADTLGGTLLRFQAYYTAVPIGSTTINTLGGQTLTISFKLKCGIYYLSKAANSTVTTWSTTSTDRYIVNVVVAASSTICEVGFTTPALPTGTHTSCEIQLVSVTSSTGTTIGLTARQIRLDTNGDDDYLNYSGENTSSFINSKDYQLDDARIGIGPNYSSNTAIFTGPNIGSISASTTGWSVDKTGPTYDINELLCIEIFSGQSIPNPKYQGQIMTSAPAHYRLRYNSEYYIFNGVSFDLVDDVYDGEWFKIQVNKSNYNPIDSGVGNQATNTISVGESIGNTQRAVSQVSDGVIRFTNERKLARTTSNISGATTSIAVSATTHDIKDGDKLMLCPMLGEVIYTLEVTANANAGATSISVVSFTPSELIETGASIMFPIQSPVINYLRLDSNFPTSDPHIFGVAWWDTSNKHMKISNG
jgi:hypothetical protein